MIFGSDYLTVLNPDFVTDLVKEYLLYAPTEPVQQGQALPPGEKKTPYFITLLYVLCIQDFFTSLKTSVIDPGNGDKGLSRIAGRIISCFKSQVPIRRH